jgi:hypothetical protein
MQAPEQNCILLGLHYDRRSPDDWIFGGERGQAVMQDGHDLDQNGPDEKHDQRRRSETAYCRADFLPCRQRSCCFWKYCELTVSKQPKLKYAVQSADGRTQQLSIALRASRCRIKGRSIELITGAKVCRAHHMPRLNNCCPNLSTPDQIVLRGILAVSWRLSIGPNWNQSRSSIGIHTPLLARWV